MLHPQCHTHKCPLEMWHKLGRVVDVASNLLELWVEWGGYVVAVEQLPGCSMHQLHHIAMANRAVVRWDRRIIRTAHTHTYTLSHAHTNTCMYAGSAVVSALLLLQSALKAAHLPGRRITQRLFVSLNS